MLLKALTQLLERTPASIGIARVVSIERAEDDDGILARYLLRGE